MLFQSTEFLLYFLPIVFVITAGLRRFGSFQMSKRFLLIASLFFYGWWKPIYLPIFLIAIAFTQMSAVAMSQGRWKEHKLFFLLLGLTLNLGLLFTFKYWDFGGSIFNRIAGQDIFPKFGLLLPLGISFFTFQNVAYLVDSYQLGHKGTKLEDYAFYLAFFPHLLAGPIMHHKELLDQVKEPRKFTANDFWLGFMIFLVGLTKKVGIADSFGMWANSGFQNASSLNLMEAWATSFAYMVQLYFDFSGYSDMAIGLGIFFGIRLPQNFNSPLKSKSIIEFWQKWHMTLTRFINYYVFMPLVRLFDSPRQAHILAMTLVTMTIAGIWHGAGWTFLIFGAYHGCGLVVNHLFRATKIKIPKIISVFLTFIFVMIGFVMFRAPTIDVGFSIYRSMLGFNGIVLDPVLFSPVQRLLNSVAIPSLRYGTDWLSHVGTLDRKLVLLSFLVLILILFARNTNEIAKAFKPSWKFALFVAVLLIVSINLIYVSTRPSEFLYFNF